MSFEILGLGTAVPEFAIAQADAARVAISLQHESGTHRQSTAALYRCAGVQSRHSVLLERDRESTPCGVATSSELIARNSAVSELRREPATSVLDTAVRDIPARTATTVAEIGLADRRKVTDERQSFYHPPVSADDFGPTTRQRMNRYEDEALNLAAVAATAALDRAGVSAAEIRQLVTVSCTGFSAPGVDIGLMRRLGIAADAARSHVGFMGCHGAFNGLRVGAALAAAKPGEPVLICCTELCSLHHQYTDNPQQIVANALFADGAAAVIGVCRKNAKADRTPVAAPGASQISNGVGVRLLEQRSLLLPETEDMMSWRIGDHGFEMTLSPKVPEILSQRLKPWLTQWLSEHGLGVEDIAHWAVHPGGPRIITAVGEMFALSADQLRPSRNVLARYGNMSSPTVLFILNELREHATTPGYCVAMAFGPGLTIEAALFG